VGGDVMGMAAEKVMGRILKSMLFVLVFHADDLGSAVVKSDT
jgi:hypothetical protein